MEPKWLGMGEYVIFRTLELKFLGRSHYKRSFKNNFYPNKVRRGKKKKKKIMGN